MDLLRETQGWLHHGPGHLPSLACKQLLHPVCSMQLADDGVGGGGVGDGDGDGAGLGGDGGNGGPFASKPLIAGPIKFAARYSYPTPLSGLQCGPANC